MQLRGLSLEIAAATTFSSSMSAPPARAQKVHPSDTKVKFVQFQVQETGGTNNNGSTLFLFRNCAFLHKGATTLFLPRWIKGTLGFFRRSGEGLLTCPLSRIQEPSSRIFFRLSQSQQNKNDDLVLSKPNSHCPVPAPRSASKNQDIPCLRALYLGVA